MFPIGQTVKHVATGRIGMFDGHCNCTDHNCKDDEVVVLIPSSEAEGHYKNDIVCKETDLIEATDEEHHKFYS